MFWSVTETSECCMTSEGNYLEGDNTPWSLVTTCIVLQNHSCRLSDPVSSAISLMLRTVHLRTLGSVLSDTNRAFVAPVDENASCRDAEAGRMHQEILNHTYREYVISTHAQHNSCYFP
jgi:hypothetical protein